MKKLLIIGAAALALAGCGRAASYETTGVTQGYKVDYPGFSEYALINVWTDPETGCESYVTDDGFMSPRLNADGSQRCPGAKAAGLTAPVPTLQDPQR